MVLRDTQNEDPFDVTTEFRSEKAQRALVYICHYPGDVRQALELAEDLESEGASCFVAERDGLDAGPWPQNVVEAIESCPFFVALLTSAALRSDEVIQEIDYACRQGRQVLVLNSIGQPEHVQVEYLLKNQPWIAVENPLNQVDLNIIRSKILDFETLAGIAQVQRSTATIADAIAAKALLLRIEAGFDSVVGRRLYELAEGDKLSLGRDPKCELRVRDKRASRRHAGIVAKRNSTQGLHLSLVDLMSTNGTWVRYQRGSDPELSKLVQHGDSILYDGAVIRIGSTDIRLSVVPIGARILRTGVKVPGTAAAKK